MAEKFEPSRDTGRKSNPERIMRLTCIYQDQQTAKNIFLAFGYFDRDIYNSQSPFVKPNVNIAYNDIYQGYEHLAVRTDYGNITRELTATSGTLIYAETNSRARERRVTRISEKGEVERYVQENLPYDFNKRRAPEFQETEDPKVILQTTLAKAEIEKERVEELARFAIPLVRQHITATHPKR